MSKHCRCKPFLSFGTVPKWYRFKKRICLVYPSCQNNAGAYDTCNVLTIYTHFGMDVKHLSAQLNNLTKILTFLSEGYHWNQREILSKMNTTFLWCQNKGVKIRFLSKQCYGSDKPFHISLGLFKVPICQVMCTFMTSAFFVTMAGWVISCRSGI